MTNGKRTDLTIVEIAPLVIERALLILAYTSLRTPDAIQAASALSLPEAAIFVTGDLSFSKISDLSSRIIS